MQTGFGGFYDGLTHLLITPSDLLRVLALPIGWLAGGWIGLRLPGEPALPLLTTLSFTLVGLLVALQTRLGARGIAALALLVGGLHGLVNAATMNHGSGEGLALLGAIAGVFALTALVSGQALQLRADWNRIVLRVWGSWIAAAGLLMLGWLARGA